MSDDLKRPDDGGEKPLDELTCELMLLDDLHEQHPDGIVIATEKNGQVDVHGFNHAAVDRFAGRLASGEYSVRPHHTNRPPRRALSMWLHAKQQALAKGDVDEYSFLLSPEGRQLYGGPKKR